MGFKIRTGSRKQELKQPDVFIGTMDRLQDWAEKNVRGIAVIVVIVAVMGSLAGFWLYYDKKQEEEALVLEFEARQFFHQEGPALKEGEEETPEANYNKAIQRYKEVIKKFPHSSAAVISEYYLGNAYMDLEDFDSAIGAYEEFLSSKGGNPVLRGFVFQRLGYAYLGKGDIGKATEAFKSGLTAEGLLNKDQIYYELGHLYHNQGNKEEAIRNYQAVLNEFPDSMFLSDAQSHLKDLGVTEVKRDPEVPVPGEKMGQSPPEEETIKTRSSNPPEK